MGIPLYSILQSVHAQIENEYINKNKSLKQSDALILENFLNEIKRGEGFSDELTAMFFEENKSLLQKVWSDELLNGQTALKRGISFENAISETFAHYIETLGGLESIAGNLINEALLKDTKNITSSDFKTGQLTGSPIIGAAGKALDEQEKKSNKKYITHSRYVKVDTAYQGVIDYTVLANENFNNIARIILSYKFTDKNYSGLTIHLGQAKNKKQIYGPLNRFYPQTGYDYSIDQVYTTGMKAINEEKGFGSRTVLASKTHFNHMAFLYELTGVGQYNLSKTKKTMQDKFFNGADFLIYNYRGGNHIYVIPVDELVQQIFKLLQAHYIDGKQYEVDFNKILTLPTRS